MRATDFRRNFAIVKITMLSRRAALLLSVAATVIAMSVVSRQTIAQTYTRTYNRTFHCNGMDTVFAGQALANGGRVDDTLAIRDVSALQKGAFVRITLSQDKDTAFQIFPNTGLVKLGAGDSMQFYITFAPKTKGFQVCTLLLQSQDTSTCVDTIILLGQGIGLTNPKDSLPLFASTPPTIAVRSTTDSTQYSIPLYNNDSSSVHIESIRLAYGNTFKVFPTQPFDLPAHSIYFLPLVFQHPFKGLNQDYLIVSVPNEPILFDVIPIQGFSDPNSGVKHVGSGRVSFWIYPNPSHGEITVHTESLTHVRVQVMDLLGRTLSEAAPTGDWIWRRETMGDGFATSGAYFLIVTGENDRGQPVREVQTVILE